MNNPIVYILINGELNMSAGKAAAQAAHAMASLNALGPGWGEEKTYPCVKSFSEQVQRTVLVLEADNTQQILNLKSYLDMVNIPAAYYIDEGVNEVGAYSITAMAIGPIYTDDVPAREILQPFSLFPKRKKQPKRKWWKLS